MAVVPENIVDRIQFYEDHLSPWVAQAVAIGTSDDDVAALQALTADARDAFTEQQRLQSQARAATLRLQIAAEKMGVAGASIMRQIRAKADVSDSDVYTLAQIPAPAKPSPIAAPGKPTGFSIELNQDGSLVLKWKCPHPAGAVGTMYQVHRQIGADGEFALLSTVGERKFVDTTVPAGASAITYQVQAFRSTAVGEAALYNVNFGVSEATAAMRRMSPGSKRVARIAA